jgi:hypothetical protein
MRSETKSLTVEQRMTNIETIHKWLMGASGVSFVLLLSFAFWLGTVNAKVSAASEISERVYRVVALDKDSLQVRIGVIEYKVGLLEGRMTSLESRTVAIEARLTKIEARLDSIEIGLTSVNASLNKLVKLREHASRKLDDKRTIKPAQELTTKKP